jgi:hypothetical protein
MLRTSFLPGSRFEDLELHVTDSLASKTEIDMNSTSSSWPNGYGDTMALAAQGLIE